MNIVVCIKQVPDTAEVKINPETNTLIRDGVENIMNPFDRQALETALILKDTSGAKVTVVSMGPPQATDILKEAIAMGADDAVLISDRALAGSDTLATSVALAAAVRKVGEGDLVLCGKQAIDGTIGENFSGPWQFAINGSQFGLFDPVRRCRSLSGRYA